jgi:histidinol dehydrogenase
VTSAATSRSRRTRCRAALASIGASERNALTTAADRVRRYHERQKTGGFMIDEADGTELGQRITPLDPRRHLRAGRQGAYPSSVLMNALPANVAGVPRS